ncbi:FAD-dependent oxidoreductase, partial [Gulbenkiania mobilis]|uniref:FAD-dependent oxidoreductase n=1 Tax=Gulbenkiania mobilis TaxID=397457 RepID=UPI0034D5454C
MLVHPATMPRPPGPARNNHSRDSRRTGAFAPRPPMDSSMQDKTTSPIHVVGGGLAGSEAAWQIAQSGLPVILHEMR